MGSQLELGKNPIFQVKAVGSFEQSPGCGSDAMSALEPDRLARLCQGECYNPSSERRPISRIEIIRIRPQRAPDEAIVGLVEDPWKVIDCAEDAGGCVATFVDDDYMVDGRDTLYYARAIEAPSLAVAADRSLRAGRPLLRKARKRRVPRRDGRAGVVLTDFRESPKKSRGELDGSILPGNQ